MNRQLTYCLLLFRLVTAPLSQLQAQEPDDHKGDWYLLPEVGLQIGYANYLDVTTIAAYHISNRLSVGAGPHLCLLYQATSVLNPDSYMTFLYGARFISRLTLIRDGERYIPFGLVSELFLHGEYEALSLERAYFDYPLYPSEGRFWLHSLFGGAGITQKIGPNTSVYYMILWDFSGGISSVYTNPQYRIGLNIYLRRQD